MTDFDIGDWVTWTHQSSKKTGQIVAVVPAGVRPADYPTRCLHSSLEHLNARFSRHTLGGGSPRKEVSFLVAVPKRPLKASPSRAKPKLYWPRSAWLEKHEKPTWAEDMTDALR